MSLWFFLSDWFGDVPTLGTLFKRLMINAAWAGGTIFVLALLQAPAEYAAVFYFGVFVVNGVMLFFYFQQKSNRTRG